MGIGEEEPCELFKKMKFPLNEFFPQPLKNISFTEEFVETDDRERDREPKPNCRR